MKTLAHPPTSQTQSGPKCRLRLPLTEKRLREDTYPQRVWKNQAIAKQCDKKTG